MSRPVSIVRLADGNFLVADILAHEALTKVNAATGNRTDIASASIGTGAWGSPNTVLLTPAGDAIMVCENFVARVNLTSGNRTLISGNGVGGGLDFAFNGAGGADLDKLGHVVIGVYDQPAVYDVDLVTGTRSVLSGLGHGSGPALSHVMDVVVLPNGQVMAEGRHFETGVTELFRIDPVTGDRTIIATRSSGNEYERLALGLGGVLLASDPFRDAIYGVDPTTGAEALISGTGLGSGAQLFWGDMVQLSVPEPASILSMATCAIVLALFAIRRIGQHHRFPLPRGPFDAGPCRLAKIHSLALPGRQGALLAWGRARARRMSRGSSGGHHHPEGSMKAILRIVVCVASFAVPPLRLHAQCCCCCLPACQIVCQTVWEEKQITVNQIQHDVVWEQQQITVCHPVFETHMEERHCTVCRPVMETNWQEERCTVMKPVFETHMQTCSYDVTHMEAQTTWHEQHFQVCRPVYETHEVEQHCTVCKPVMETVEQQVCHTVCDPVTTTDCCGCSHTCYVPRVVTETVPRQVCRMVPQDVVQKVPVQTCRMVAEDRVCQMPCTTCHPVTQHVERQVPVTTCHCVPQELVRKVPIVTCHMVTEEQVHQVPVCTCRVVSEQRTIQVPHCVEKVVPVTITCRVPHVVTTQVPCQTPAGS